MPQPPDKPPEKPHGKRPGLTKDKDKVDFTQQVKVNKSLNLSVKSTLSFHSKTKRKCHRRRCVEVAQLGSAVLQPEFGKLRIDTLLAGDDVSAGATSESLVLAKKGMSVMLLCRLTNFDDASYHYQVQEKQNGAWANKPDVPPVNNVEADGLVKIIFTVSEWTEIRLVVTEDGGGVPVGNLYVDAIY